VTCLKVREKTADILALTNSYAKLKDAAGSPLETLIKSLMILLGAIIRVDKLFVIKLPLAGREDRVLIPPFTIKCMLFSMQT